MSEITFNAQLLNTINSIITETIGYSRDRKINFTVKISEADEMINIVTIYNDTGKIIFEMSIDQNEYIETVKSENKKDEEKYNKRAN